ncbi:MAG: Undecaprenyl phosphate-alpha-4-amino-4-deoxy-L-arabinose arabinosyl transferase [Candidatus Accumulibacter sp. BA-94]|nr:MAG: Undecaprenyl phosphate-alpha-4-amino-4-deoxy-L-arabinose arabinosyl transferase [Candidatus Accumulibacter sp. BA-94]
MGQRMAALQKPANAPTNGAADRIRFIALGLLGFVVDLVVTNLLYRQGIALGSAQLSGFLTASGASYFLSSTHLFKYGTAQKESDRLLNFIITTLLILFLRTGILTTLIQCLDFPPGSALLISITASSILSQIAHIYPVFSQRTIFSCAEVQWHYFSASVIAYSILLRLFYLGPPELFFEEAYYWNYAKHLDIGYLDHPPMVAWIIALFIKLMGDNEFAVRFGAFICWFITAYFAYKLTFEVSGRSRANQAIVLAAALPAYFAVGMVMTPDAPLMACWAMAIYFFHQALIHERRTAWVGLGFAIGLGMLSKYTIILLGPAALLFILADRDSRKWLFRWEPYLAIIIALVLFSPVIVWNAEHAWVSFLFQGHDRAAGNFDFSLPDFIGGILLLLTPTGIFSVIAILLFKNSFLSGCDDDFKDMRRSFVLLMTLALFPTTVFAALSLFRETKFHWTGPCWLAILPYLALLSIHNPPISTHPLLRWTQRAWPATLVVCLLCYGAVLHYLVSGFPGVPYPQRLHLLGWREFGHQIELLTEQFERDTGEKPLVVGMDRNRIASGLAFYRTKALQVSTELSKERINHEPAFQTTSWHLFDGKSLMYERWFPIEEQNNKNMLLVSKDISNLTSDNVRSRTQQASEIGKIMIWKNGRSAGSYYYCLVKGYQSQPASSNRPVIKITD